MQYTSAATHDHFLLCRSKLNRDDIIALDRAYIDYAKFEEMTKRDTIYVTKMKKKLISLLTNDFEMPQQDIIDIYRKRWTIEKLFYAKQIVMQSRTKKASVNQSIPSFTLQYHFA